MVHNREFAVANGWVRHLDNLDAHKRIEEKVMQQLYKLAACFFHPRIESVHLELVELLSNQINLLDSDQTKLKQFRGNIHPGQLPTIALLCCENVFFQRQNRL